MIADSHGAALGVLVVVFFLLMLAFTVWYGIRLITDYRETR